MMNRDEERDRIARALAGGPLSATSPELRETLTAQAEVNVRAREQFVETFELVPATAVNERRNELEIDIEGKEYYPACLLEGGQPSAVALSLLNASGGRLRGWTLALWLAAPNRWLSGRAPADLIRDDPAAVQRAAEMDGVPVG